MVSTGLVEVQSKTTWLTPSMLALHVYPSNLEHESRILKVSDSQIRSGFINEVVVVGIWRADLAGAAQIDERRRIVRLRATSSRWLPARVAGFVLWSVRVLVRFRRQPIGLISCHSLSALPVCVALKWLHRAVLVYEPHELETDTSRLRGWVKWLASSLERRLVRSADHVIVVSDSIRDWYQKRLGVARVSVALNCPRQFVSPATDHFRSTFRIPAGRPIFLYQGILSRGRGIETLLNAFGSLQDTAALVLMGYGPLAREIERQCQDLSNVFLHPPVSPERLLLHTAAADFGVSLIEPVSLSYEYCAPNKLFEYIMARKPVLVSPTTDQRRIVNHYGVGQVCDSLTPEGVRAAARRLMADGVDHYAANLERARKDLCWEQQEKVLMDVYRRILPHAPQESGTAEAGPI
jgi:glycosyltransferase involved in cell wall biosynthesis